MASVKENNNNNKIGGAGDSGGGDKKSKIKFGVPAAPQMVLKMDNGKVVSIANEENQRITQPSSTVLVYRCIVYSLKM